MSTNTRTYTVPGISCEHCKHTIEDNVRPLEGVETVTVDIDAKTVTVTGGDADATRAAIARAGYTAT